MPHIQPQQTRTGYLLVILAAVLFAISGTAAKFLFNSGFTAFQLIQLRITLACAGLLLWLSLRHPIRLKISRKHLLYFCCLGVFGIGAAQFFYLLAISRINVASAILLHYTGPVFVAVYVVLVRGQKLNIHTILAIIGTLLGCYFMVGAYNVELHALNWTGILAGLLAAIAFAAYSLMSDAGMRTYTAWTVLLYGLLFAALMWNVLHPPLQAFFQSYTAVQWSCILFIGIFGTIFPFGLYFEGIKRIEPTHASITATLEPISAGVIAALFLGEHMAPLQIFGGVLVIISIVRLQLHSVASKPIPID